jgi:hypothetical protein
MGKPFSRARLITPRSKLMGRSIGSDILSGQKFDGSTGQIYIETTVRIQKGDDQAWASDNSEGKSFMRHSSTTTYPSTRSLQEVAIQSVVENIADITLDVVEGLPARLLILIWEAVCARYDTNSA